MPVNRISEDVSLRIKLLRGPLIVGVILGHAWDNSPFNYVDGSIEPNQTPYYPRLFADLLSNGLPDMCVHFLFIISGFLFFQNFILDRRTLFKKFRSRTKSLLIPYILWIIFSLSIVLMFQTIPQLSKLYSGSKYILDFSIIEWLGAFGINQHPAAYGFWFIRDLIVMVILSPIFFIIVKKIPLVGMVFFLLLLDNQYIKIKLFDISPISFFYFYVGAVVALKNINLEWIDTYGKEICLIFLILSLLGFSGDGISVNVVKIFKIMSIWYLVKIISANKNIVSFLLWLSSYSFVLYAAHGIPLNGFKKILHKIIIPINSYEFLFSYLIPPLLVIILSLLFFSFLKKCSPNFYKLISGGR